ncbi:hypothetical protein [Halosimplex amylolyticum]|uniref:hypothetical protein n=1 Tax=Halosimplex amylolyticum TaxID=3396616 RepID=UPI003F571998
MDVLEFYELELDLFEDWLLDTTENEPVARLILQLIEWGISQPKEDSMELSDVSIESGLEDLPKEAEPFADMEVSEKHEERMRKSMQHIFRYFSEEEYYKGKEHRQHAEKGFEMMGISPEVLKRLRNRGESVLFDSELEDEVDDIMEHYFGELEDEFDNALASSLNSYRIR